MAGHLKVLAGAVIGAVLAIGLSVGAQTVSGGVITALASGQVISWNNDTSISRNSSGVVQFGTGAGNANGDILYNAGRLKATTVAGLESCSAGLDGNLQYVTDATTSTKGSAPVGGGSVHTLVYCDGSGTPAWKNG